MHVIDLLHLLWFNFILGLNVIFFCFKLIIIHYHTPKQKKITFKPRIKLNHNTPKADISDTVWRPGGYSTEFHTGAGELR